MYSRVLSVAAIVTMALAVQAANSTAPYGNTTNSTGTTNGTNGTNTTTSSTATQSSAASITNFSSGAFVIAMIAVACSVMSL
ncbi:hypothetical protein POMI540_3870 [Schizosaccharomyces pombe]|uniref:Uncharacterized protein C27E2.11c, mitochondrial n=1 Tax=Schizosaccharomyces pombe (strain 972 / ATCC 24843) TaxID=284812 RepID=YEIB_SCHPO|nr:uncharacterized protein SPAC27E2.11c [Schizosaccharomyces pombe]Q9UTA0.1 RecName: Full=Uncharacterized protein C27E2.11c, mitochondrial; Flags: Precursor [Schizosaccharomyces pombe 972h-]CAB60473.1 sequence orphan [Schizosaccharomyces pombe]|eukprot:NP_594404.1 uncharacterized protein SPAC27E2.11c [Schizosaccharomyces pombe]